jgi:hypothetical protein
VLRALLATWMEHTLATQLAATVQMKSSFAVLG